jgi:H+/Cl- antiporter ClcA
VIISELTEITRTHTSPKQNFILVLLCDLCFILFRFVGVVSAGVYSLVGAAGMVAAVTQTISVAVVMFEMTGRLRHALPVFVLFSLSFFLSLFLFLSLLDFS